MLSKVSLDTPAQLALKDVAIKRTDSGSRYAFEICLNAAVKMVAPITDFTFSKEWVFCRGILVGIGVIGTERLQAGGLFDVINLRWCKIEAEKSGQSADFVRKFTLQNLESGHEHLFMGFGPNRMIVSECLDLQSADLPIVSLKAFVVIMTILIVVIRRDDDVARIAGHADN